MKDSHIINHGSRRQLRRHSPSYRRPWGGAAPQRRPEGFRPLYRRSPMTINRHFYCLPEECNLPRHHAYRVQATRMHNIDERRMSPARIPCNQSSHDRVHDHRTQSICGQRLALGFTGPQVRNVFSDLHIPYAKDLACHFVRINGFVLV